MTDQTHRIPSRFRRDWLDSLVRRLASWRRYIETRRQLREVPAYVLRDIGLDETQRMQECSRWFWQGQH